MEHRGNFAKRLLQRDWTKCKCPGAVVPERMAALEHVKNRRLTGGMIQKYGLILPLLQPNSRVLDACCGGGWGAQYIANSGHSVVGMDKDGYVLEIANKRQHPNLEILDLDFFKMDLGQFDAITFVDAIEHFTQEDQFRVIQQLDKHLKPGGLLLIDTPWGVKESRQTSRHHKWELSWEDFGELVFGIDHEWTRRFFVRFEQQFSLITESASNPGDDLQGDRDQIIVLRKKS